MEQALEKPVGVTKDVIETFLATAKDQGISDAIIEALRKTLIEDGKCAEQALLDAIYSENSS